MKYIFVAGAPGSKWSSVCKNIYSAPGVDRSDYRSEWTYHHDASGRRELMHFGAYFDPGMICHLPEDLKPYTKEQLIRAFDSPFSAQSSGTRIIKSHIFANNIDFLRETFPDTPIVLVHRSDDACLGWWVKCGHFDITYPNYGPYYKDLKVMAMRIRQQNQGILNAWYGYQGAEPENNTQLAEILAIGEPDARAKQEYAVADIGVKVI